MCSTCLMYLQSISSTHSDSDSYVPMVKEMIQSWYKTAPRDLDKVGLLTWGCALCRFTLRWRHNGRDSISNHQPHDCLLNRLFRRRSKKTSKLRVTSLCAVPGEFPAQMASNAFDGVIMTSANRKCPPPPLAVLERYKIILYSLIIQECPRKAQKVIHEFFTRERSQ